MTQIPGYFRFPIVHADTVTFVCEDDIWTVSAGGGVARRLTAGVGEVTRIAISPNGVWLAFTSTQEKTPEVYCMPAAGGPARRLTYLGAPPGARGVDAGVRTFTPDGEIVFVSNTAQPFVKVLHAYTIACDGGIPKRLPIGPASEISFGPCGGMVIGRNTADPARWKRYRGGTAGDLWIDAEGRGQFSRLIRLSGNPAHPMWIGDRIYFVCDHEGIGNLYSCTLAGDDLRRHTGHDEYYVRFASSDGHRIVYQCGADLHVFDPQAEATRPIDIDWRSPRTQSARRFVEPDKFVGEFFVHPQGHSLTLECRGKLFAFPFWEEAPRQVGNRDARCRFGQWLADGETIVTISDASGEPVLEMHRSDGTREGFPQFNIGHVVAMLASPTRSQVALTNQRMELLLADLESRTIRVLDRSRFRRIESVAWSPDGAWLAYDYATSLRTTSIKLCEVSSGQAILVTRPEFRDFSPAFDPEGKYLYFLSYRVFDPVYDSFFFDLNFPRGVKPCLVALQAGTRSPFLPRPKGFAEEPAGKPGDAPASGPLQVDLDGIEDRVCAFPVPEGLYRQIAGMPGKALFTSFAVAGNLGADLFDRSGEKGTLEAYDFASLQQDVLHKEVAEFKVVGKTLVYRVGTRLRALKAGDKADATAEAGAPGRKSGWIDLKRLKVSVEPSAEWRQMFRDVWRLQRDYFWVEDMAGVDWDRVYRRYLPLLGRVTVRSEFSDLVWEMQGELGTSHAYEIGGDYRPVPDYPMGFLGADLSYDSVAGCYRFSHIVRGDPRDPQLTSPLCAMGVQVRVGDRLIAINGRTLTGDVVPQSLLVNHAGVAVELTVADADGANTRRVVVTTLGDETPARYREWVETNRRRVHDASNGRVGYVHVPDMMAWGYSEFHRTYYAEAEREALIVDGRFNRGGHVSQLVLEKIARRPIGYGPQRWGEPEPYPADSVAGPKVALTNELAGSDGDIFAHCFKLMKLGPLVGKRTWGGVIGINPRYRLADGSITTQPEYASWFVDVGWAVENYGTDPDVDVDIAPQDYAAGRDTQLEKALEIVLHELAEHPPKRPDFGGKPVRALPALPQRGK